MVARDFRVVSCLREHALACAIATGLVFWGLDALLHTMEGSEGFMENLLSTRAHTVATRFFIVALFFSFGFLLRVEYLRRHSEAEVRASERRFRILASSAPVGVFECDASGRVVYVNDRASALLGLSVSDCLGEGYAKALHEDDRLRVLQRFGEAVRAGRPFREECRLSQRGAGAAWVICEAAPLFGEGGTITGFIGTITDISERKQLEERLQAAAFTDELTGLFNRRGFFTLGVKQVEIALRAGYAVGLVYLDVNRFKEINDRWGHKEGDRALQDVADILRGTFRKSDILGRIGGDEFVVFLPEVGDAGSQRTVLANLRQKLADHNAHAERRYTLELSAGVAFSAPGLSCSLEELLLRADRDMYREKRLAKVRARSHVRPIRPGQTPRLTSRIPLEGVAAEVTPGGTAKVVDISLGGVCLMTPAPLQVCGSYVLRLSEGAARGPELSAEAVWVQETGVEPPDSYRFRTGLRFGDDDGRLKGVVSKLITGHW